MDCTLCESDWNGQMLWHFSIVSSIFGLAVSDKTFFQNKQLWLQSHVERSKCLIRPSNTGILKNSQLRIYNSSTLFLIFVSARQSGIWPLHVAHAVSSNLRPTRRFGVVGGSRNHNRTRSSSSSIISTPSHSFPLRTRVLTYSHSCSSC